MSTNKPLKPQPNIRRALIKETLENLPIDEKAKEENKDYISKARNKRREQNTLHWGYVCLVVIAVGGVAFAIVAKVIHIVVPQWGWLTDLQERRMDDFLTTGAISSAVVTFFKNRISNQDENH